MINRRKQRLGWAMLIVAVAALNCGCGTGNESGSASGGSGGISGAGGGGGDANPARCNSLTNVGAVVHLTADPGPPPVMTGGTIVDGTYVLTSLIAYGTAEVPVAETNQETNVVTGNITQVVSSKNRGADRHSTIMGVPTGTAELIANETCPPGETDQGGQYTATPTSYAVMPSGAPSFVATYTLR